MRRNSLKSGLLTLLLAFVLIAAVRLLDTGRSEQLKGEPRVSDGDSFWLSDRRIRLIGLDAPELAQSCRLDGREQPCGTMARDALREIVAGGDLTCEPEGEDRYGRLLARCYLGDDDIGAEMVRSGWAVSTGDYGRSEAAARAAGVGIWSMEFAEPSDWRAGHGRDGETRGGFWSWFRD